MTNLGPLPAFSLPSHPYLQPFFFIELYRLWVSDVFIYSEGIFYSKCCKIKFKNTKKNLKAITGASKEVEKSEFHAPQTEMYTGMDTLQKRQSVSPTTKHKLLCTPELHSTEEKCKHLSTNEGSSSIFIIINSCAHKPINV